MNQDLDARHKTSKDNACEESSRITDILPHRPPFLFVTRAISIEPGRLAVAEYDIPQDHVFFQGHFPKEPVFPGVITLEMMAQTAALAVLCDGERRGQVAYLAGVESARFRRPVRPGDTLRAQMEIESMRLGICKARGKSFCRWPRGSFCAAYLLSGCLTII